jgi:hypothetical protein
MKLHRGSAPRGWGTETWEEPMFCKWERIEIARLILLKSVRRRLELNDAEAANDVRAALDSVDPSDWMSCLHWSAVLANQGRGE